MTAHTRFRKILAVTVGAFLASTALAASTVAPADAGNTTRHKHELSIYKAEKYVKLDGTFGADTPSVSCPSGDIALDGMWEFRSVDKAPIGGDPDDDPDYSDTYFNDARDLYVKASYPDEFNQSTWNFKFENRGYGDIQLSIYVVCISRWTQATNNHNHQIGVRNLFHTTQPTVANTHGWANRTVWDSSSVGGGSCLDGEYFVAPGFDVSNSGSDHRLVASYATNAGKSWGWEFGANNFYSVEFYGKCIDRRVLENAGHRHSIAMQQMPRGPGGVWGHTSQYGHQDWVASGGDWRDFTYTCDQDNPSYHGYKAAVGMFWMGHNWEHNWFLGMEPRPKTRAFRFFTVDGWGSSEVKYGALCINTRTSNPVKS